MDAIDNLIKYKVSDLSDNLPLLGVYFLFKDDELIYIGRSTRLFKRIKSHISQKDFNYFSFVKCDTFYNADYMERTLINKYKPKLNNVLKKEPRKDTIMTLDGDLIRKLRLEKGLSQERLSDEINCSREIIILIERNSKKSTSLGISYKIGQYFNIPIMELILKRHGNINYKHRI